MFVDAPHYKLSVDQYDEMVRRCIFPPEARLELLDGELIEMSPQGTRHANCVRYFTGALYAAGAELGTISVQLPMYLSANSEPEPDLALLKPPPQRYLSRHPNPTDVLLLIEIAVTSRDYDRDEKVPRYAEAGISEVWLVDFEDDVMRVYREPHGRRYYSEDVVSRGGTATALLFPNLRVAVEDVLGPAD